MSKIHTSAEGNRSRIAPGDPDHRPDHEKHTWGMFPGLAVELGGYGDVELRDPFTGARFWFQPAAPAEGPRPPFDFLTTLRQALDAAEAAGFFAEPTE